MRACTARSGRATGNDVPDCLRRDSCLKLTSLELKLIKIGARVVCHVRAITFQLAEVAVTGLMVRAILAVIRRLRAPPLCAWLRS